MSSASPRAASKLRVSAIVFGWLADIGGSAVAGIALFALFGVDPSDTAAAERLAATTPFLLATLPSGLFFTSLGGFVAAHLARGEELNNAFVVGVASAITGLLFSVGSPAPLWYLALSVVLTPAAAVLGGYTRARTRTPPP